MKVSVDDGDYGYRVFCDGIELLDCIYANDVYNEALIYRLDLYVPHRDDVIPTELIKGNIKIEKI